MSAEPMTKVREIKEAISKLTGAEIEEVSNWIDEFLEDQLELTDEVKMKLEQSHREFNSGLETWLLEAADKPATPLTKSNFDDIRKRVRFKLGRE